MPGARHKSLGLLKMADCALDAITPTTAPVLGNVLCGVMSAGARHKNAEQCKCERC